MGTLLERRHARSQQTLDKRAVVRGDAVGRRGLADVVDRHAQDDSAVDHGLEGPDDFARFLREEESWGFVGTVQACCPGSLVTLELRVELCLRSPSSERQGNSRRMAPLYSDKVSVSTLEQTLFLQKEGNDLGISSAALAGLSNARHGCQKKVLECISVYAHMSSVHSS